MRTEAQNAASRANGRRSQGPVTPEGKSRSSQNAFRHGLLATCVVLKEEGAANFQAYLDQHIARFLPADDVEMNIVEEMVSAAWRARRATGMQTIFFNTEFANVEKTGCDGQDLLASVNKLAEAPAVRLLHRYETHYHRVYHRCIDTLLKLQKAGRVAAESALLNEPEPIVPNEPEPIVLNEPEPVVPNEPKLESVPQPPSPPPTPAPPKPASASPAAIGVDRRSSAADISSRNEPKLSIPTSWPLPPFPEAVS
jgi:hypothetical protein